MLNLLVVAAFALNLYLRYRHGPSTQTLLLSVGAILVLGVSGWLGATMVHVHGQSVVPPEGVPKGPEVRPHVTTGSRQ